MLFFILGQILFVLGKISFKSVYTGGVYFLQIYVTAHIHHVEVGHEFYFVGFGVEVAGYAACAAVAAFIASFLIVLIAGISG